MQTDRRVISYILPKRIMWKQSTGGSTMENEGILLKNNYGQTALGGISFCHLKNGKGGMNSMLFDFGAELQGGNPGSYRRSPCKQGETESTLRRIGFRGYVRN